MFPYAFPGKWPLVALVALLILSAVAAYAYRTGHRHATTECEAEKAASVQRAWNQWAEQARQDAELSATQEQSRARIETTFRHLREAVHARNYVIPDCGLPADGLRDWNAANGGGAAEAPAGQPDGAVRSPPAGGIGQADGSGRQPSGGGGDVSPVPGPATRPGEVGNAP